MCRLKYRIRVVQNDKTIFANIGHRLFFLVASISFLQNFEGNTFRLSQKRISHRLNTVSNYEN